jgi:hypothetical protein
VVLGEAKADGGGRLSFFAVVAHNAIRPQGFIARFSSAGLSDAIHNLNELALGANQMAPAR